MHPSTTLTPAAGLWLNAANIHAFSLLFPCSFSFLFLHSHFPSFSCSIRSRTFPVASSALGLRAESLLSNWNIEVEALPFKLYSYSRVSGMSWSFHRWEEPWLVLGPVCLTETAFYESSNLWRGRLNNALFRLCRLLSSCTAGSFRKEVHVHFQLLGWLTLIISLIRSIISCDALSSFWGTKKFII